MLGRDGVAGNDADFSPCVLMIHDS